MAVLEKLGEKAALVIALVFCSLSCFGSEADPDNPLIFSLETPNGSQSCLIAINHLVLRPALESAEILACEKRARALVLESNPAVPPTFSWSAYERKKGELGLANLHESTVKKIIPALKAAQYSDEEIKYFLTLHPVAIYRALVYSKALAPNADLKANLDIQLARVAHSKYFKIIEMEGMKSYFQSERQLDVDQIDLLISRMCDLLLKPERMASYAAMANGFAQNLSAQPDVDTAWNKKVWFNTVVLGLPQYTVFHDVDNRNFLMVDGMLKATEAEGAVLIFIGSAHIGGPNGVLKLLEKKGVKATRIR